METTAFRTVTRQRAIGSDRGCSSCDLFFNFICKIPTSWAQQGCIGWKAVLPSKCQCFEKCSLRLAKGKKGGDGHEQLSF